MNLLPTAIRKILTVGFALAITSSVHATVLFSDNFDSYANGTADATYKANYAGASGAPTFVITNGGLSGSKSFQATGDGTLIRTNVPINLAAGPITIDVFFQRGTAGQAASPQIGVMTNFTGALNTSESVGGRFNNLEALDVRSTVGGAQNSVGTAPGATLTTGNWYFLRGIITSNAAANSLTVVLQLFNSDSAGVVGTGIVTNTQTFNNASVYVAAAKLYAAVRLSGSTGVTNMDNFSVSQAGATPTITGAATATAFTTTYGTASANQSFSVSGANLTANLVATAQTGFEVATSSGGTYASSVSFTPSSGSASGTVYVRLAATAAASASAYNSVTAVVLSSTGATSANITTASSGNTVSVRVLTFTGSKTFDGNASATATQLTFGNNLDGANLTMSGSVTLAGATAGSQSITSFSGLTLGGSAAGNYTLTGASGTVTVNAAPPSITGAATATAFTTTYGAASTAQGFSVSGANLTADLVATAATGFEVANGAGAYGATATFTQTGGSASGTLNVRLKANAAVSGTYNSVNAAVLSSTGATSQNITTTSSGNTVSVRVLTFTGSKSYDNSASATAAQLAFGNNVDNGNLTMSGSVTLAGATAGSQSITSFSGLTLGGSAAANYTLTGASGTVTISARALTFTGSKTYDGVASATAAQLTFGNNLDGGNLTMSGSVTLASANVGSPSISSFGGLTLGGSAAGNYTLTGASGTVTVSKATPVVTVTVGTYTYNGSAQGPNTFTTSPSGDTGTATWSYVGTGSTTYTASSTPPTAAGTYTAQVTALTSDANFNSSLSSATAFSILNVNVLFTDNYTVSYGTNYIDFENTLGREAGSLFPLSYLTRYTGGSAFLQQVGSTTAFTTTTNVLFLRNDAGVRVDNDFSTVGAPIEIKWSVVMNWFGFANSNSLTIGNRSDGYDPTNAAFTFHLRRDGTTAIYDHGVATAGASGTNFGENVLVDYKVVLSDTAGTGSPFGSGGSKVAYYQSGVLLGTANLTQLTAGQGYIGFVGGVGNVGIDNLQIGSVSPASITLTGPLGAVNTFVGNASPAPSSFAVSGSNLTGAPGNLTVTPPFGFEVSRTNNSGYSTSLSVPYSSDTLASTNVYVRLAVTTALGTYSGNIIVSGGGDAKTIATALSTVSKAPSTITYGNTSFTYNGSGQGPSITFGGSTGVKTTNYVGTGYASVNPPTNAGSYYASNTVAADANFNGATNTQSFTINQATPTISGVTASQSISYGTASVTLSGTVSAGSGYPANGETVSVTINGNIQPANIAGGAGGFSVSFPTATIPPLSSAYTITYAYAGDANLNAATSDTSTALTVTGVKVPNLNYTSAPGVARIILLADIQAAGLTSSQGSHNYSITVGATSNGGTVITNGAGTMIKYTNSPSFVPGSDSFPYTVTDGPVSGSGTVTLNFASVAGPAITPGTDGSGHAVISFHGIPGYSYHVQRATTLSPADWTNAAPVTLSPTGDGSYSWTNTISPADGFYRLSYP